jgi:hypothetical protein
MLHYFKFRQDLADLQPAKDVYINRGPGSGWPEHCPPIRAANGFGFDVLANFDITFSKRNGVWSVKPDIVLASDFDYAASDEIEPKPLVQQYAWFWEKGQKIPHVISDNVWTQINNQVKISSFLFLKTDPNELLLMSDIPNMSRPWRALSAVIDADWYPASYPWHCVLELCRDEKKIRIKKGEPLCRLMPIRRDTYFSGPMTRAEFDEFFTRSQNWLTTHGKMLTDGAVDITKTYVKQQARSRFIVMK